LHDPLTWEDRMVGNYHESTLVGADAIVLLERQVDACETRVVHTLAEKRDGFTAGRVPQGAS
jgi:hypothetical protein